MNPPLSTRLLPEATMTQVDLFTAREAEAAPEAGAAPTALLATLQHWAQQGWLRRLDSALAAFVLELDPGAAPALLLSAAVLAHMEGRGHTCLPLRQLVEAPKELLAWPAAAEPELELLWRSLPVDLPRWLAALRASPLLRALGPGVRSDGALDAPDAGQPLVLGGDPDQPLLYLRRYWLHEREVAAQVLRRSTASQALDPVLARQWLERLFDATSQPAAGSAGVDWQKLACAVALRASLTVITGGPGTGKTYTAARLLALLFAMHAEPERLRVALAAPTGKAAARLRQSIDSSLRELDGRLGQTLDLADLTRRMGAARTLHSLLGARPDTREFAFNAKRLLDIDVLIVDEASMVHLEMMSALLQALPPAARLILLGDKDQLASVEAGAVLGDLCRDAARGRYAPETADYAQAVAGQTLDAEFLASGPRGALSQQTVMLRQSRRFGGAIGQLALAVNAGDGALSQKLLAQDSGGVLHAAARPTVADVLALAVHGRPGASASYANYLELMRQRPAEAEHDPAAHADWVRRVLRAFERFRVLCAVHEGEWGRHSLNQGLQKALAEAGLLKARGEWFAGRPVMVSRNEPELGVFNGDVGIALPGARAASALRVYFLDGDSLRSVGVSRLAQVETAFAMTVHKSQGSEFEHTTLVLPPGAGKVLTRELVYTGITRARENFTLFEAQAGLLKQAIERQSQRASGLAWQLEGPADSPSSPD